MNARQKLLDYARQIEDVPDTELAAAIPIMTPGAVRIGLSKLASQVRKMTAEEVDGYVQAAHAFLISLTTDDDA